MGDDLHLPWLCASPYSLEFRRAAVAVYRGRGRPLAETARRLGVPESELAAWVERHWADADEPTTRERDEVRRTLKRVAARDGG